MCKVRTDPPTSKACWAYGSSAYTTGLRGLLPQVGGEAPGLGGGGEDVVAALDDEKRRRLRHRSGTPVTPLASEKVIGETGLQHDSLQVPAQSGNAEVVGVDEVVDAVQRDRGLDGGVRLLEPGLKGGHDRG